MPASLRSWTLCSSGRGALLVCHHSRPPLFKAQVQQQICVLTRSREAIAALRAKVSQGVEGRSHGFLCFMRARGTQPPAQRARKGGCPPLACCHLHLCVPPLLQARQLEGDDSGVQELRAGLARLDEQIAEVGSGGGQLAGRATRA